MEPKDLDREDFLANLKKILDRDEMGGPIRSHVEMVCAQAYDDTFEGDVPVEETDVVIEGEVVVDPFADEESVVEVVAVAEEAVASKPVKVDAAQAARDTVRASRLAQIGGELMQADDRYAFTRSRFSAAKVALTEARVPSRRGVAWDEERDADARRRGDDAVGSDRADCHDACRLPGTVGPQDCGCQHGPRRCKRCGGREQRGCDRAVGAT